MKYFSLSGDPIYLQEESFFPMARMYWGASPLPKGAELVGGYSDKQRAGALIKLASGIMVCGNDGAISNIPHL